MNPWRAALTSATASGNSTRIASRSAIACSSAPPFASTRESAAAVSSTAVFSVSVANCSRCASATDSACCSANSRRPAHQVLRVAPEREVEATFHADSRLAELALVAGRARRARAPPTTAAPLHRLDERRDRDRRSSACSSRARRGPDRVEVRRRGEPRRRADRPLELERRRPPPPRSPPAARSAAARRSCARSSSSFPPPADSSASSHSAAIETAPPHERAVGDDAALRRRARPTIAPALERAEVDARARPPARSGSRRRAPRRARPAPPPRPRSARDPPAAPPRRRVWPTMQADAEEARPRRRARRRGQGAAPGARRRGARAPRGRAPAHALDPARRGERPSSPRSSAS